jgi:L-cysteine desulfidase
MPPFYPPIALVMSLEGALMAATAAAIYRLNRRRIWPALIAAIAVDRAVSTALMWLISGKFGLPPAVISLGSLIHGFPGVLLQLAVIPLVLRTLKTRNGILFNADEKSTTSALQ